MKGARSLTDEEVTKVFNQLKNERDKALFLLGIRSGLRISELLSLKIEDILEHGSVGSQVRVAKKNTKGQIEGRILPLTQSVKEVLQIHLKTLGNYSPSDPLFLSRQGGALSRMQAHRILKEAFNSLELKGSLSSHALRKTYAHKIHRALGEKIEKTQIALGHKNISSTQKYLAVDQEEVVAAILSQG